MCFQRPRARTWYIPPWPGLPTASDLQQGPGTPCPPALEAQGTPQMEQGIEGDLGRWSAVPKFPIKCPGSLAPWTPPDCPLVLVTWVQLQGPCLGGLLNARGRLLALFLAAKWYL